MSDGVTRGILEAHRAGAVTSASMVANAPGFDGAVRAARTDPGLDLGLHFNLTIGPPLSPAASIPSLCDGRGRFLSLGALIRRSIRGGIDSEHVVRECRAQLERLRESGITATHLDAHRHAHLLPGVWAGVVTVARAAGVPLRVPLEPFSGGRVGAKLALRIAWRFAARAVPAPAPVLRVRGIGLLGGARFADRLIRILDRLPPGDTELVVHPGYADADLLAWDPYGVEREWELAALRSSKVLTRLAQGAFRLARFADL